MGNKIACCTSGDKNSVSYTKPISNNTKWVQVPFEGEDINSLDLTHAQAAVKVWLADNQGWEFTGKFRKIEAQKEQATIEVAAVEKPKEESKPEEEA